MKAKFDFERKWVFVLCCAVLIVAKLVLTQFFYPYICPPLAPLDDDLMFSAANSILAGEWLGAYGWLTMAKHMGFAVWLAFLHVLHIPYLVGGQLLLAGAALFTVCAFSPVLKSYKAKLLLFTVLFFNPAAMATFTFRIYRDNIFPAVCLLVFAGFVGYALRYRESVLKSVPYLAIGGLAFGFAVLCREDGYWLAPFVIIACAFALFFIWRGKDAQRYKKTALLLLPVALCTLVISAYSYMNYSHYGRFIISDFSSGEFSDAYGALTRVEHEDWQPTIPVPREVLQKLYEVSPAMKTLEVYLEDDNFLDGYIDHDTREIGGGAFYWALRKAANEAGYYKTAQSAQVFFEILASEVNAACDAGLLAAGSARSATTSPIKVAYVAPVTVEAVRSFTSVLTFAKTQPEAIFAVGTDEEITEVEEFIYAKGARAAIPGTDEMYMSPVRKLAYDGFTALSYLYGILTPIAFIAAVWGLIKRALALLRGEKQGLDALMFWAVLGILGMAVLRCFMIAFVEVSAFGIGTYVMYLSTVHPLVLLVCFFGAGFAFENKGAGAWRR